MKHLGDITKINGFEAPIVDIITGGSPCQDLSVAGKRAGLDGERSGLFMEQIRIVKEMREHDRANGNSDKYIRPRYMVWENVPGAFSSNKGEDFRCVLEEVCRIADKTANVPMPEKGKWSPSGCIMGDGWSVAWRVHDAQFWGVPQRRKRIALVADFGGASAPEILFERKSVSGDIEQSEQEGEEAAGAVGESIDTASAYTLKIRGGSDTYIKSDGSIGTAGKGPLVQTELSGTLGVSQDQTLIEVDNKRKVMVLNDQGGQQMGISNDGSGTLRAEEHGHSPCVYGFDAYNQAETGEVAKPLTNKATDSDHTPIVYGMSAYDSNAMKSSNPHSEIYKAETARTLDLNGGSPACNQGGMMVVQGADVYNGSLTGEVAATLSAACGGSNTSGAKVVCSGFVPGESAKTRSIGYEEERSPTIGAGNNCAIVYGWHRQDSRITEALAFEPGAASGVGGHVYDNVAGVIRANAGDNQQAVAYGIDQQGGKGGANYTEDVAPTMASDSHGTPHAVCYSQDTYSKFTENDNSASLKACGGSCGGGGGGEPCDTVGALCAVDYKGAGNQYVNDGKLIIQRIE